MKFMIAFVLATVMFSAHAELKRLTDVHCVSEDQSQILEAHYDSSISPFGPQSVSLNGKKQTAPLMMSFEDEGVRYRGIVHEDNVIFTILMKDEKTFKTTLESAAFDTYKQDEENPFNINGEKKEMNCNVKTRFRL